MSFDKIVEELIKKAQERGEFDNLPGKGKPIDLSAYFEMPEDVRVAHSVLKNAGFQFVGGEAMALVQVKRVGTYLLHGFLPTQAGSLVGVAKKQIGSKRNLVAHSTAQ